MNSGATLAGTAYPNVASEFISDIRTGTTYPNVAPEFISDIRTGMTYPNVATEFISMNLGATLG
jgi:hypothetical protein